MKLAKAITSWFLKRGVSLITKLSLFIFILGLLLPSPCFSYNLPPDNTLRVELKWVDERANVYRLLKKSFFLRPVHGLTRAKYYPQACLKQTGVFLKNNKPKPFDGIIREICHLLDSLFVTSMK